MRGRESAEPEAVSVEEGLLQRAGCRKLADSSSKIGVHRREGRRRDLRSAGQLCRRLLAVRAASTEIEGEDDPRDQRAEEQEDDNCGPCDRDSPVAGAKTALHLGPLFRAALGGSVAVPITPSVRAPCVRAVSTRIAVSVPVAAGVVAACIRIVAARVRVVPASVGIVAASVAIPVAVAAGVVAACVRVTATGVRVVPARVGIVAAGVAVTVAVAAAAGVVAARIRVIATGVGVVPARVAIAVPVSARVRRGATGVGVAVARILCGTRRLRALGSALIGRERTILV